MVLLFGNPRIVSGEFVTPDTWTLKNYPKLYETQVMESIKSQRFAPSGYELWGEKDVVTSVQKGSSVCFSQNLPKVQKHEETFGMGLKNKEGNTRKEKDTSNSSLFKKPVAIPQNNGGDTFIKVTIKKRKEDSREFHFPKNTKFSKSPSMQLEKPFSQMSYQEFRRWLTEVKLQEKQRLLGRNLQNGLVTPSRVSRDKNHRPVRGSPNKATSPNQKSILECKNRESISNEVQKSFREMSYEEFSIWLNKTAKIYRRTREKPATQSKDEKKQTVFHEQGSIVESKIQEDVKPETGVLCQERSIGENKSIKQQPNTAHDYFRRRLRSEKEDVVNSSSVNAEKSTGRPEKDIHFDAKPTPINDHNNIEKFKDSKKKGQGISEHFNINETGPSNTHRKVSSQKWDGKQTKRNFACIKKEEEEQRSNKVTVSASFEKWLRESASPIEEHTASSKKVLFANEDDVKLFDRNGVITKEFSNWTNPPIEEPSVKSILKSCSKYGPQPVIKSVCYKPNFTPTDEDIDGSLISTPTPSPSPSPEPELTELKQVVTAPPLYPRNSPFNYEADGTDFEKFGSYQVRDSVIQPFDEVLEPSWGSLIELPLSESRFKVRYQLVCVTNEKIRYEFPKVVRQVEILDEAATALLLNHLKNTSILSEAELTMLKTLGREAYRGVRKMNRLVKAYKSQVKIMSTLLKKVYNAPRSGFWKDRLRSLTKRATNAIEETFFIQADLEEAMQMVEGICASRTELLERAHRR
ncbi:uncharacterized protein KNAG_0F03420 [Huiozyma naganishii CBS 8797]|uniref:Uncharacterized protein n=1 Tax=Huiozyma naganishii (strain ATCC MYA-139 / BCRC 22969 / CBS 8797 / KCTC 17520 / NBRC 10181 / NCYC 3082 / Yp74L-3) TaxID=1071383 RepID=J7S7K0_HUIN7|nr:hypothetical protein KNAG_0F03420 [Kazachstania naganishii CBS 8797]CCK71004.1 hypothetical protein KNAG_0F03420 [Kazachstania naganishii CBS 8797]